MYTLEYLWNKFLLKIRGKAIVGSNIHKTSKIGAGCRIVSVSMGRHSFCGYDCTLINCRIGAFCSLADNVSVGLASHPVDWVSTSPVFIERKGSIKMRYASHPYEPSCETSIGNDVWIGKGAYIKAGVHIGNGAVVGMGSVVTKDVPDYAIVAGVPAKIIRRRFDDKQIEKLRELKWWDWADEKISKYASFVTDINKFLEKTKEN